MARNERSEAQGDGAAQTAALAAASSLLQILPNPTPETADRFGRTVAIDGDLVLVGAPLDDTQGDGFGQAYLFDATTGALIRTIPEPTPSFADRFGSDVALSGDVAAIGAEFDSTDGSFFGQVHLIDVTTGALLRTLTEAPVNDGDGFGGAVDFDGERVLVGSTLDTTDGEQVGKAWLFDAATGDLIASFEDPTPTDEDKFGEDVALSGDLVLVGAPDDDTRAENRGQAHLFDADTGALIRTFDDPTPTGSGSLGDRFGTTVAVDAERAIVGAFFHDGGIGEVHVFDTGTGALLRTFDDPTPSSFDRFGRSLALDGDALLVGAETTGAGDAHLFDLTTGALVATFDDPTPDDSFFGDAVALSGGRAVIGAWNADATDPVVDRAGEALVFAVPIAAVNDRAQTAPDTAVLIEVVANDFGPDPEALVVTGLDPANRPENGTVGFTAGPLRYTPDPGFAGIDIFAYTVADGAGGTDSALVSVRVGSPALPAGVTRGTPGDDGLLIGQNSAYVGVGGADSFLFSPAAEANAISLIDGAPGMCCS